MLCSRVKRYFYYYFCHLFSIQDMNCVNHCDTLSILVIDRTNDKHLMLIHTVYSLSGWHSGSMKLFSSISGTTCKRICSQLPAMMAIKMAWALQLKDNHLPATQNYHRLYCGNFKSGRLFNWTPNKTFLFKLCLFWKKKQWCIFRISTSFSSKQNMKKRDSK